MSNKSSDESREGLRLLALDGGGIRGLSELVILGEIMDRIKATDNLPDTPRPCEYFDLIGGTSTGGLIAIMLGRLGMTVQEAIEAYTKFAGHVFTEKKWAVQDGTFKATRLQEAIQEIVEKHAGSENARMRDDPPLTRCKTIVCAMPAKNMSSPRIFRSHDVPENQTANCKIWEAARATSAAPTFFKRVSIDHDGLPEEFVDAGLGCNNPVNEVYNEAQLVFGRDREISCIVSIGTGHPKVIGFSAPDKFERLLPVALIGVLQSIATDCEKVAEDFERKYNSDPSKSKVFFRFNVQQGLQDVSLAEWNKLADVKTHTTKYVQETAVGVNINRVRDIVKSHSRLTVHRDVLVNETGDLR